MQREVHVLRGLQLLGTGHVNPGLGFINIGAHARASLEAFLCSIKLHGIGGFLRSNDPTSNRWYSRDVQAIAQARGLAQAAPFFVDAGLPGNSPAVVGETKRSSNAELQSQQWPQAGLTQIRFTNNHLVYALTWYGLALMVAGAAWLVLRYQQRADSRGDIDQKS